MIFTYLPYLPSQSHLCLCPIGHRTPGILNFSHFLPSPMSIAGIYAFILLSWEPWFPIHPSSHHSYPSSLISYIYQHFRTPSHPRRTHVPQIESISRFFSPWPQYTGVGKVGLQLWVWETVTLAVLFIYLLLYYWFVFILLLFPIFTYDLSSRQDGS